MVQARGVAFSSDRSFQIVVCGLLLLLLLVQIGATYERTHDPGDRVLYEGGGPVMRLVLVVVGPRNHKICADFSIHQATGGGDGVARASIDLT